MQHYIPQTYAIYNSKMFTSPISGVYRYFQLVGVTLKNNSVMYIIFLFVLLIIIYQYIIQ